MPKQKITQSFIESVTNDKSYTVEYFDTECTGLILNVTSHGTKSFSYRYKERGSQKRITFGKYPELSINEARVKTIQAKIDIKHGRDPKFWEQRDRMENQVERARRENRNMSSDLGMTLEELSLKFKELYMSQLRESTRKAYWQVIDKHVFPTLGNTPLNTLSKKQLINILDDVAIKQDKPATANKIRTVLSKMFNWAVQRDYIETNYISNTSSYSAGKVKRERFFNEDEIKKLWKSFEELHFTVTPYYFKILFLTGQRRAETRKMKWSDINFNNNIWTIPSTVTKNKTTHTVPLSRMVIQLLKEVKEYSGDSVYVFESPRSEHKGKPISSVKNSIRSIRKTSKIKDFRVHDIRRTVATNLAKLKVERTVVGKILNHKGMSGDDAITAIYDRHSYDEEKRVALNKWAIRLQEILNS